MVNVVEQVKIFPTVISEFKYVADYELSYIIEVEKLHKDKGPFVSSQSINNKLHEKKEYQPLVTKILNTTEEVCQLYRYKYKSLEITNLWINHSKKGVAHNPHNHSNNIFSGVWYPFENISDTPIIFQDPRPSVSVLQPNSEQYNLYNTSMYKYPPTQSMGLIFPSWLYHFVPPASNERLSLSWNVILRGEYGRENTLQNAHI
jgi:uncharacterized protein (TIGR02466 family)